MNFERSSFAESASEAPQPTPEEEGKPDEIREKAKERMLHYIKSEHLFRYGELAPDHPAQKYVNDLVHRLPLREGITPHVVIAPQWKEVNAFALENGTIVVSAELIKEAEDEETLLGVLAHEYVHVYRHHAEQRQKPMESISAEKIVGKIGVMRGQEYEADLRAVLSDLEAIGVNPLAYKAFLERLHSKEEMDITGVVHGSSMDRALNIATVAHMIDLKAITKDVHPVPPEIVTSLDDTSKQRAHRAIVFRPKTVSFGDEKEWQHLKEERLKEIEELEPDEVPYALETVYRYTRTQFKKKEAEGEKDRDPSDEQALQTLFKKLERQLPASLSDEERRIATLLGIESLTSIPVLTSKKGDFLYSLREEAIALLRTPEDLEHARRLVEERKILSGTHLKNATTTMRDIVDFAMRKKVFGSVKEKTLDIDALGTFIESWTATMGKLSEERDIHDVASPETMKRKVMTYISQKIADRGIVDAIQKRLGVASEDQSETGIQKKLDERENNSFYNDGKKIGEIKELSSYRSAIDAYKKKIPTLLNGVSLREVGKALTMLFSGIDESQLRRKGEFSPLETFQSFSSNVIVAELFNFCLEKLPQFASLSEVEKNMILLAVATRLGRAWGGRSYLDNKSIADFDMEEEMKENIGSSIAHDFADDPFIVQASNREVKKRLETLRTVQSARKFCSTLEGESNAEPLYRWLCDESYYNRTIGLLPSSLLTETRAGGEIFMSYLTRILHEKSFVEIDAYIKNFAQQGIDLQEVFKKNPEYCGPLVASLAVAIQSDSLGATPLVDLISAKKWIQNPFLQNAFERYLTIKFWPSLPFEEKLELLFPKVGQAGFQDISLQEKFLEEEVTTQEQVAMVQARLRESIEGFLTSEHAGKGVAAIISSLKLESFDVNALLQALLRSSETDGDLKSLAYEGAEIFVEEKDRSILAIRERMRGAERLIRNLYSLDNYGRQLLLRAMLASQSGVLPNAEKRKKFLDFVFDEWIGKDPEQKDVVETLSEIKSSLAEVKEWQLLYFAFQSVLRDSIAIPPEKAKETPWIEVPQFEEDLTDGNYFQGKKSRQFLRGKRILQETIWDTVPKDAEKNPATYFEAYSGFGERLLQNVLTKEGALETPVRKKLTPLGFVKEAGSRLGSPGVRFLQLLPQFATIPPKYEEEFAEVYDAVKGQSKLAAVTLLEREWPDVWETIATIGKRVGGGSIMTVYETETKSGEHEVIKVRNPNIQYHVDETCRFATDLTNALTKKHGGGYAAAGGAIADIKRWIEGDISFEDFLSRDKEFRESNSGFQPPGYSYTLYVPQSKGPENPYFAREERIEGKNLTKWDDLVREGHDMKEITSLLARNYITQIQKGLVHSDVHIGNFRVTPDKKVAVFDRNYYLQLSDEEKELVVALINPFVSGDEKKLKLSNYFSFPEDTKQREEAQRVLGETVASVSRREWDKVSGSLVKLKQLGVKIPLPFTLLLKNFNALQTMTRKAGFRELSEAFFYSPGRGR